MSKLLVPSDDITPVSPKSSLLHTKGSNLLINKLPLELKQLLNKRIKSEGVNFLKQFPDMSVPLVFFDPQYRGIMDKLDYGNEGARQKGRALLTQMSEETIITFIQEIDRVLAPSSHFMLWIDKFHLVEGILPWIQNTQLAPVDMITWDKGKIGMGYRTRRKSEYLVIFQKYPKKAKGHWNARDIPDVWIEKVKKNHPHSKPEQLQAALINSTVKLGDFVLDPASGGFSVMRSALAVGRNFLGCDLLG